MRLMELDNFSKVAFTARNGQRGSLHCDTIAAFDIETTTYYRNGDSVRTFDNDAYRTEPEWFDNAEKLSVMYVWQFAVEADPYISSPEAYSHMSYDPDEPLVYMGRTWEEFYTFLNGYAEAAVAALSYMGKRRPTLYVYVHNLGYEFQHMRGVFGDKFGGDPSPINPFDNPVFARNNRTPLRAVLELEAATIEFRDSLALTQKSLAKWCKDSNLPNAKLETPAGYYDVPRLPVTPLTDFEIEYSVNDVVSMVYGLQQYRKANGGRVDKIPMTQTGNVRRAVRKAVKTNEDWCSMCQMVTASYSFDDFKMINHAFVGGWTHANAMYTGKVVDNVKCFDFASDYPFCMSAFKYPYGAFKRYDNKEDIARYLETDLDTWRDPRSLDLEHRYIVQFTATGIVSNYQNTFWSSSKAFDLTGAVVDNGKIQSAERATFIMTDLDYHMFKRAYSYDSLEITSLMRSGAAYLPLEFKNVLFKNYGYKTTLRGVAGQESKYVESKQIINSMYGVAVTKNVTDQVGFNTTDDGADWETTPLTEDYYYDYVADVMKSKVDKNFLTYDIGVFITAYARYDLWDLICAMDSHVVYGDTDSLKGVFDDDDVAYIAKYNEWVVETEQRVAAEQGFDESLFHPRQPSGKECRLGVFDREDDCEKFKTLGAKRYAVKHAGHDDIEITVAGLPKYCKVGTETVSTASFLNNDFDNFCDGATWEVDQSGKKTHYYNDDQPVGLTLLDREYNAYTLTALDRFGIGIVPTTFSIGLADNYKRFLESLAQGFMPTGTTDDLSQILK